MSRAYYISHPQVLIDTSLPTEEWGLNDEGRARSRQLADSGVFDHVTAIWSSSEAKTIETATPLARRLDMRIRVRPEMDENDRSATGFLPQPDFEAAADVFFSAPDQSFRGWETARDAQRRVVRAVGQALEETRDGDLVIFGHGAVGTLLFCALTGQHICRSHDQIPGGGNFYSFDRKTFAVDVPWTPIENLFWEPAVAGAAP